MELRIDGTGYSIIGTPEEMHAFLKLEEEQLQQDAEQKPELAIKKRKAARKEIDWGKVRALRDAGWSYEKIAEEMRVSVVTLYNRRKEGEGTEQEAEQYVE